MPRWIAALWKDENGFVVSAELVLIASLLVVGLIVGLTSLQGAVNGELSDVAGAIRSLDQSYYYHGHSARMWGGHYGGHGAHGYGANGCDSCTPLKSWTAGSYFFNRRRNAECTEDINGCANGVQVVPEKKIVPVPEPKIETKPCETCPQVPAPQVIPESGPQLTPPCGTCLPDSVQPGTPLAPSADPKSTPVPNPTPAPTPTDVPPKLEAPADAPAAPTPQKERKPRKKGDGEAGKTI